MSSSKDGSTFDEHRNQMTLLNFPDMKPNDAFKDRLAILEETAQTQSRMNQLTYETFGDSKKDLNSTEEHLKALLSALNEQLSNELGALRREYEHRFELQNAENRRLQSSFALLKAESTQTNKKLVLTIEKLRTMQLEFGVDQTADTTDEFSALALSVSRPNTVSGGSVSGQSAWGEFSNSKSA